MKLPVQAVTANYTYLPSDKKKKISFRHFLVGDTKAMLMAQVSEDPEVMFETVKSVVQNCLTTPLSIPDMFVFDFEHLFLKMREVSVGEISRLRFFCKSCNNPKAFVEKDIDLREIKTEKREGHTAIIPLFNDVSVHMTYLTVGKLDLLEEGKEELEGLFDMVAACVESVYDGDVKLDAKDFTREEMHEFLNALTEEQFAKIENFFATSPRPTMTVEYECPECHKHSVEKLEGLRSFF